VFPAVALLITTLAFNLLGDGIRDAMDPRTERIFAAGRKQRRGRGRSSTDTSAAPAPAAPGATASGQVAG
jgi:hypothetical protein